MNHEHKEYSAVDCLSFAVMETHGICQARAVDSDFGHRFVMTRAGQATTTGKAAIEPRCLTRCSVGPGSRMDQDR